MQPPLLALIHSDDAPTEAFPNLWRRARRPVPCDTCARPTRGRFEHEHGGLVEVWPLCPSCFAAVTGSPPLAIATTETTSTTIRREAS